MIESIFILMTFVLGIIVGAIVGLAWDKILPDYILIWLK